VSERLRVFIVAPTAAEIEALMVSTRRAAGVEVVGHALRAAVDRGVVSIPAEVDAVVSPPPRATGRVEDRSERVEPFEALTARERTVLGLVADGLPNRDIARELGISEHTVKFHLSAVFGKLGVGSRTEAVRRALELGLVTI
jgi:DNA-binding NarL/FixJ family response regulator